MGPLGFIMLEMCIAGVGSYREDQVFLVVLDTSTFGSCVPIILGTSTIRGVINIIKESEMDELSIPWATAKLTTKLSLWKVEVSKELWKGVVTKPIDSLNLDEILRTKEKEEIVPFSTQVIHRKLQLRLTRHKMHVMTMVLSECKGTTPYGLQIQNVYTDLRDGSNSVPVVIKNTTRKFVILNKGIVFAKVVATNEIPTLQLKPSMMEALDEIQGIKRPRMSISKWRKKLIQKLDLSGFKVWPSELAKAAKELLMEHHDIFALDGNELGCTSTIEHIISLIDLNPYKERFHKIPPPLLDEVQNTLKDMLDSGAFNPSQSPWCNVVVLIRKKDGSLHFCINFQRLNNHAKKDSFPLPQIQEALVTHGH